MKKKSFWGAFVFKSSHGKHLFGIKRIPFLILLLFLLSMNVEILFSQNLKFSFGRTEVPLEQILSSIEKQSNYLFVYTKDLDIREKYRLTR